MRLLTVGLGLVLFMGMVAAEPADRAVAPRDCAEIRAQATRTLGRLALLLNQLADPAYFSSERNDFIQNSFDPDNPGRIFYHSKAIVENDLNPVGSILQNTGLNDKKAKRYLHDFDLLYDKKEKESIFFTNFHFGPFLEKEGYLLLHILYDSQMQGRLKDEPDRVLPRHKRVATLRAERTEDGPWRVYVLQVNFYRPAFEFVQDHQDADCDGIVDAEDNCPAEAGNSQWGGCPPPPNPDFDRDGIADLEDDCPNQMGPWCAGGCPMQAVEKAGDGQVFWEELLGNEGQDVAFDVTRNETGLIVFAGETETSAREKQLYMAIFDPCRKYLSNRIILGGEQDDGARKIIQLASGEYVLAGYTESSGSGTRDAWLIWTDGTNKTGEKIFGTGRHSEEFTDVVEDIAGNLILAGQKDGRIWLVKTDQEGAVVEEVTYQSAHRSMGMALAQSPLGAIFLTGYEQTGRGEKMLVLHYNEVDGRLEKIYEKSSAKGLDIIVDADGQLVVAGAAYTKRNREDILLLRLHPGGRPQWKREKTFGGIGVDVGCAILETASGDYAVAGYSSSNTGGARGEKCWVHLLSKSGDARWEKPLLWGDRFSERAYGITQIESNSIILAGMSRSSVPFGNAGKSDFRLVSIALPSGTGD